MNYKTLLSRCTALELRLAAAEARIADLEHNQERRESVSQRAMTGVLAELKRLAAEGETKLNTIKIAQAVGLHQTHTASAIRALKAEGAGSGDTIRIGSLEFDYL